MPAERGPGSAAVAVELSGVHKAYGEGSRRRDVLRGADLAVQVSERLAVVGPSGSGKSTLLNVLSGIDLPDSGRVAVHGVDTATLSERDRTLLRRSQIGFVFQFFNLIPTLTVLENLLLPVELVGGRSAEGRSRARELLDVVELSDRGDDFPDVLSGGEQQRVAIARALVHRPKLVLADEPTGNLDGETEARVVGLLDTMVVEEGATLIVVTHSPTLAARMDRVVRLESGRLVEAS